MILEKDYGEVPDRLEKPLNTVLASSSDMVDTLEYFLDVTRIERDQVDYDMTSFDMKDLVTEATEQMESVVRDADLSFHVDIDSNQEYPVYADRGKIKQVIQNLIDNSVHYTEQGSITVHLWRNNGQIRVEIKDTGVGLSAEDKKRIFEKFGRANHAEKRNVFGAGLGLYIAKQVLADHEGAITAESEGRGKGATFTITLPVSTDTATKGVTDKTNES